MCHTLGGSRQSATAAIAWPPVLRPGRQCTRVLKLLQNCRCAVLCLHIFLTCSALPALLQYVEMCAQGPDAQALRGTLSVLIMQLSRPVHGSSSSSTVAELVFEEAMLLQLYKARIQPARLDADGKLLSGLNQTFSALKQAPASDQSKATFKTRLKVGVCRFALAISYAQLQDDGQLLLLFVCFVDVLPAGWMRSPTAILSTVAH